MPTHSTEVQPALVRARMCTSASNTPPATSQLSFVLLEKMPQANVNLDMYRSMSNRSSLGISHLAMQRRPTPPMSANPNDKKYTAYVPRPTRALRLIARGALPFRECVAAHQLNFQRYHLQAGLVVLWPCHFLPADWTFRNPFARPRPSLSPLLFPCDESFHEARVAKHVT